MKKVIICGAAGMVGRGILEFISENNCNLEVWAADISKERLKCYECDNIHPIENCDVEKVLSEIQMDTMLQMAFPRNVKPDQWADGIRFAAKMLEMAKEYEVKSVINISSQSIYGLNRTEPASEDSPISLNSPYTTGKYCMELMMGQLFYDRPYTNIRLSTIIGPATPERVVNKFLSSILAGNNLIIKGGSQIFSLLDVRDAASGLVTLLMSDASTWRHVYNLGTRDSIRIVELAEKCEEAAVRYGIKNTEIMVEENDTIELNSLVKVDAFYEDFGWKANHTMIDSIENIISVIKINN